MAGPVAGEKEVPRFIETFPTRQNTHPFGHAKKIVENPFLRLPNEFVRPFAAAYHF